MSGAVSTDAGKKVSVVEMFGPTLQGEGAVIGMQTMFVRFGGCDYRCKKCDSLHAVLPELIKQNSMMLYHTEIMDWLRNNSGSCKMVTFSGGNPVMWDLSALVHALRAEGWTIAVETQGSLYRDWLDSCHYVTLSPKGPGMGEKFEYDKFHNLVAQVHDLNLIEDTKVTLKVVIFDQRDIEFAKQITDLFPDLQLYLSCGNPWPPEPAEADTGMALSRTMFNYSLMQRMALLWEQIKQEPLLSKAIFLPQMHVLLWGNDRGR